MTRRSNEGRRSPLSALVSEGELRDGLRRLSTLPPDSRFEERLTRSLHAAASEIRASRAPAAKPAANEPREGTGSSLGTRIRQWFGALRPWPEPPE